MEDCEKIEMVLEWAYKHPKFDTSFIESLEEALSKYDYLTDAQSEALDNIIKKFRIKHEKLD